MKLIDKLRAADGPDRELDAQLWAMEFELDWWEPEEGETAVKVYDPNNGLKTVIGFIDPGETRRNFTLIEKHVPTYTASIDAVRALICEKAPKKQYWSGAFDGAYRATVGLCDAQVNAARFSDPVVAECLASLIALLTALEGESA